MDDSVLQAMVKWPDVPACYGWLRLDARGRWRVPTGVIEHPRMVSFIGRNYTHDASGHWYFQNGPQRVYVDLDYTPRIYRVRSARLVDHTGFDAGALEAAYLDEGGAVLLRTAAGGLGVLDDRDLASLGCEWDDTAGRGTLVWQGERHTLQPIVRADVPRLGAFVAHPRAPQ